MTCDKCSQINREEDFFCVRCGNLLVPIHLFQRSLASKKLEVNYLNNRYGTLKSIKSVAWEKFLWVLIKISVKSVPSKSF